MPAYTCDILVIGSGIAGLSFALHCAETMPEREIVVLSKAPFSESNTHYAQGGIAAVMDRLKDSYHQHIEDTLSAGAGLCDTQIVKMVVQEAPRQMLKLTDWGVRFDRNGGEWALGKEGGHSTSRILHVKDHTGAHIGAALLEQAQQMKNIALWENISVRQLRRREGRCTGAWMERENELLEIRAPHTMLATGGAGQLYQLSSNPAVATGDGIALAQEAGARLANMAFVQFHPTVLYAPQLKQPFLISEAVRGFGAILRNYSGEDFMYEYDARGSLATRDIVSRALFMEMQKAQKSHLWLDLRHLNYQDFARQFPTIARRIKDTGYDVGKELVPVVPAAHYLCGGIVTNAQGLTTIPGLWACGEVACTGLHGANRLASNSLLEALVFAARAAQQLPKMENSTFANYSDRKPTPGSNLSPKAITHYRHILQNTMTQKVGIVRHKEGLQEAEKTLKSIVAGLITPGSSRQQAELSNLCKVGLAVIADSLQQPANHGAFYREDLV